MDTEPQPHFRGVRPDQPIAIGSDDRLERREFAHALAEDIRQAPRTSGFVIALTGEWGEGKTSVVNLIGAELEASDDAVIVHFNPWLFSGTEQLVEHFFDELVGQLREKGPERLASVAAALETYGRVVAPLRALPWVGEALRSTGMIAADAGRALQGANGSARSRATSLRERLAKLETPIVIVVDDLDRLRADEIIDVMRLVRLVGDFPNLVYLLAFDRPRVEEALGEGRAERGRAYLEKVVQVSHALPPVRPQALRDFFDAELQDVVGPVEGYSFDRDHFVNLFRGGISDLFRTARDIRRFTNVLPATLALLTDEVDLADMLVLEALRLFVPDTFAVIVGAPEAFTTPQSFGALDRAQSEGHKAVVQSAVGAAGAHHGTIEAILPKLFPAGGRHLGGPGFDPDRLAEWRRQRRVANPEVLAIYLSRRLPPGTVAAARIEAIFDALEDQDRLDTLLHPLDPTELNQALSRLEGFEREFPQAAPEVAITVLSRQGRRLHHGRRIFGAGGDIGVSRVLYLLLRKLTPEAVARAVRASNFADHSTHYDVVRIIGHREGAGHRLVDEQVATQLENSLRHELFEAAPTQMADERDLMPLIGLLLEGDESEGLERVCRWAVNDDFFIALARAALMVSFGSTLGEANVRRSAQLDWPRLTYLLGEDLLRRRFGEIDTARIAEDPDDDVRDAWRQGLHYLDHPDEAEQDLTRWPDGDERARPLRVSAGPGRRARPPESP